MWPAERTDHGRWRRYVTETGLAACAGATDLLAVVTHGGAFASVVTGNLVLVGYSVVRTDVSFLVRPATAVAGFAVGVAAWLLLWRTRPRALVTQLGAELALLVAVAAGWLLTDGRPVTAAGIALLAGAGAAMGAQSAVSLRLGAATTYLTGTLTRVIADLLAGRRGRQGAALREIGALIAGAATTGLLLLHLRWAAPLLPVLLLGLAIAGLPHAGRPPDRFGDQNGPATRR